MHDASWTDDEFRAFITTLHSGGLLGPEPDAYERARFLREASVRLVPDVQRRVLADVGVTISPAGVASVAYDVLEGVWGKRRTWLLVTVDPWGFLADLVAREIRSAYRASARSRRDGRELAGIAHASSRPELAAGTIDDSDRDLD